MLVLEASVLLLINAQCGDAVLSLQGFVDKLRQSVAALLEGSHTRGGPAKSSPELPAPLRLVSAELAELGTAFGRIVHFNRTVFGPFCAPILRNCCSHQR
ncbi:hypothetical protein INR49_023524, partial [Caranx melampygus]